MMVQASPVRQGAAPLQMPLTEPWHMRKPLRAEPMHQLSDSQVKKAALPGLQWSAPRASDFELAPESAGPKLALGTDYVPEPVHIPLLRPMQLPNVAVRGPELVERPISANTWQQASEVTPGLTPMGQPATAFGPGQWSQKAQLGGTVRTLWTVPHQGIVAGQLVGHGWQVMQDTAIQRPNGIPPLPQVIVHCSRLRGCPMLGTV